MRVPSLSDVELASPAFAQISLRLKQGDDHHDDDHHSHHDDHHHCHHD